MQICLSVRREQKVERVNNYRQATNRGEAEVPVFTEGKWEWWCKSALFPSSPLFDICCERAIGQHHPFALYTTLLCGSSCILPKCKHEWHVQALTSQRSIVVIHGHVFKGMVSCDDCYEIYCYKNSGSLLASFVKFS